MKHVDDQPLTPARGPHLEGLGVSVFHGFTSTPASVEPLASVLRAAGCLVDVPLLPGHGTRWQDLSTTPRHTVLRAALASHDRLAARSTAVAAVGLSMGGALALHVAAHRAASGVVVINPCLRLQAWTGIAARLIRPAIPSVAPVSGDIAKPGVVEEDYDRTPVGGVVALDRNIAQVRRELDQVTAPVLLMRSARDNVLPVASADTLVRRLDPRQLSEVVLQRSQHVATLDHDADLIGRLTLDFLARTVSRQTGAGRRHLQGRTHDPQPR